MSKSAFCKKIKHVPVMDKNEKINCDTLLRKIGFLKKEKHSLKSQLGHALKELKDLRSKLNEKNVLLSKQEKELHMTHLEIVKRDLMEEHMVNMCFRKHIIIHDDMDKKEIEKNILTFKTSLEVFKNEILNKTIS